MVEGDKRVERPAEPPPGERLALGVKNRLHFRAGTPWVPAVPGGRERGLGVKELHGAGTLRVVINETRGPPSPHTPPEAPFDLSAWATK